MKFSRFISSIRRENLSMGEGVETRRKYPIVSKIVSGKVEPEIGPMLR